MLAARGLPQLILLLAARINLRRELVIHDTMAWGLLDGGLIFSLILILIALMIQEAKGRNFASDPVAQPLESLPSIDNASQGGSGDAPISANLRPIFR